MTNNNQSILSVIRFGAKRKSENPHIFLIGQGRIDNDNHGWPLYPDSWFRKYVVTARFDLPIAPGLGVLKGASISHQLSNASGGPSL